jgi:hypothetical protein
VPVGTSGLGLERVVAQSIAAEGAAAKRVVALRLLMRVPPRRIPTTSLAMLYTLVSVIAAGVPALEVTVLRRPSGS